MDILVRERCEGHLLWTCRWPSEWELEQDDPDIVTSAITSSHHHLVSLPNACIFSHMLFFLWHYTEFLSSARNLPSDSNRVKYQEMGGFVIGNWVIKFQVAEL